jgi:hypothetical protein
MVPWRYTRNCSFYHSQADELPAHAEGSLAIPATLRTAGRFPEGLAAVREAEGNEWIYVNKEGQIAIPSIACGQALPFEDGLAMIQGHDSEEVGYINRRGEFVWPLRK